MTNDQKISTIATLLREMSDEFGTSLSVSIYNGDKYISNERIVVSVGPCHGLDEDPTIALTKALSEHERTAADRKLRAEIEAEFKARKAA